MKRILFALVVLAMIFGMAVPVQASSDQHQYRVYDILITGNESVDHYYTNPICVSGSASVINFQGQINQYSVLVKWVQTDGTYREDLLAQTDFSLLPGESRSFSGNWSIPCQDYPPGNYTISIQLYHSQPGGSEVLLYTYPIPINVVIVIVRVPPSVTTNAATEVGVDSAVLNGNLDDLGSASSVDVGFQWGTDTTYSGTPVWFGTMYSTGNFSAPPLTGLTPDTTYHFRSVGVGIGLGGFGYGEDMTFTTYSSPPEPDVTSVDPDHGYQGQENEIVTISGSNFIDVWSVSFGSGITVNDFDVDSASQITADISIATGAVPGARDVSVTTLVDTGTLAEGFIVLRSPNPSPPPPPPPPPSPTPTPTPTPTPVPPVVTPTPTPTPEVTPTPVVTPTPTPTATPTPTPTPASGVPGVPWSLIGGLIAAAIAAGLLLFFLLRRRRLEEPDEIV